MPYWVGTWRRTVLLSALCSFAQTAAPTCLETGTRWRCYDVLDPADDRPALLWATFRGQCPLDRVRISPSAPGNLDKLPTSWSTQICSDLFRSVCVSRRGGGTVNPRPIERLPELESPVAGPTPGATGAWGLDTGHGVSISGGGGKARCQKEKKTRPPSLPASHGPEAVLLARHQNFDNLSLLAVCHGTLLDGLPAACPSRSRLPRHTRGCWLTTWQRPCYSVPPSQAPPVGALQKWGRGRQHTLGLDQINLLLQRPGG